MYPKLNCKAFIKLTKTSLQSCLSLQNIQHHIVAPIILAPHTNIGRGGAGMSGRTMAAHWSLAEVRNLSPVLHYKSNHQCSVNLVILSRKQRTV